VPSKNATPANRGAAEAAQVWAERAVDNPIKLARAARIVRAALERGRLTVEDLSASEDDNGPEAA
jgi:hypothetical protein